MHLALPVTEAMDDDDRMVPMFTTSMISGVELPLSLIDCGLVVELVSENTLKKLQNGGVVIQIHKDEGHKISLADNSKACLTQYAHLLVIVAGVQASVKCYIVDANSYNILLRLWWIRRTWMHCDYDRGEVHIKGWDGVYCRVDIQLAPIDNEELPTVITDDIDDELQDILDNLGEDEQGVDDSIPAKDVPHRK